MTYRQAILTDIPQLNRLAFASKKYWGYPDDWMEAWRDELSLDGNTFTQQQLVVGEVNGEIIGFCSITEHGDAYEILHLWVLPEHIGLGYGKALLNRAIDAYTLPDKPIIVVADPNAEEFYRRQGFVTFERRESSPPGRFLPVMKRPGA